VQGTHGLAADLGDAAEDEQRDALHRDALPARDNAMRQLMQDDRGKEGGAATHGHDPVQEMVVAVLRVRWDDFGVKAQRQDAGDEQQRRKPGDVDDDGYAHDTGDANIAVHSATSIPDH
jgi:hypothetical protein